VSTFVFTIVHFLWRVGTGWLGVRHLRARVARPDAPRPMPTLHVVTGTLGLPAVAFAAIDLAVREP